MYLSTRSFLKILIFFKATYFEPTICLAIFAENNGHIGVTSSLLDGLNKLNYKYSYNSFKGDIDIVVVLAGVNYLKQAIALKKKGRIKKILAGPNLVTRADEQNAICADPAVDICLVPSEWVKIAYLEEVENLKKRVKVWAAGIDIDFWKPQNNHRAQVLLYWKTESLSFVTAVKQLLSNYFSEIKVIRYGTYSKEQFREQLDKSFLSIFISRSESQGLALAEAWAMNVPTLVWNPEQLVAHGRRYSQVSAAPYLTEITGQMWKTIEDLKSLLDKLPIVLSATFPRKWIQQNITTTISAQSLLTIIEGKTNE